MRHYGPRIEAKTLLTAAAGLLALCACAGLVLPPTGASCVVEARGSRNDSGLRGRAGAVYGPAALRRGWATCSVGSPEPSTLWLLAEGCTGEGFETWILVQNPGDEAAGVDLTYMTPGGAVPGPSVVLQAGSRATFNVADTVAGAWDISTRVDSDRPVVAERAMYGASLRQVTVAWQPSHQDDTGPAGWHEYYICNDMVERAMPLATEVINVKCWDTSHGLTGTNNYRPAPTNTPAFDVEIATANDAHADYFIAIHNDATAPSGILGECMPGDAYSRQYLQLFMGALCARTGLPSRGINEVRLYSLEPERNSAPVRILLEIGDSVSDREKLESPEFRQLVAQALADVANALPDQR